MLHQHYKYLYLNLHALVTIAVTSTRGAVSRPKPQRLDLADVH